MMADPARLSIPAPAKINLYLHLTGKRSDGYHLLDSLIAFAGIHDRVLVAPADGLNLTIEGPFGDDLKGTQTLQTRTFKQIACGGNVARGA